MKSWQRASCAEVRACVGGTERVGLLGNVERGEDIGCLLREGGGYVRYRCCGSSRASTSEVAQEPHLSALGALLKQ